MYIANIASFDYHFSDIESLETFLLNLWEGTTWFPVIIEVAKYANEN